jgi:hypothetical protein
MLVPGTDRLALSEHATTSATAWSGDHKGTTSQVGLVFPARPVFATSEFLYLVARSATDPAERADLVSTL